jgi:hypothetical protein
MRSICFLMTGALLAIGPTASAAEHWVVFSGVVTQNLGEPAGITAQAGAPVTGWATYDTAFMTNTTSNATSASYLPWEFGASITIDGVQRSFDYHTYRVVNGDNAVPNSADVFELRTTSSLYTPSAQQYGLLIDLADPTRTAINSLALPGQVSLNQFPGTLAGFFYQNPTASSGRVEFQLTSISVVPEPVMVVPGMLCVLLACRRRR